MRGQSCVFSETKQPEVCYGCPRHSKILLSTRQYWWRAKHLCHTIPSPLRTTSPEMNLPGSFGWCSRGALWNPLVLLLKDAKMLFITLHSLVLKMTFVSILSGFNSIHSCVSPEQLACFYLVNNWSVFLFAVVTRKFRQMHGPPSAHTKGATYACLHYILLLYLYLVIFIFLIWTIWFYIMHSYKYSWMFSVTRKGVNNFGGIICGLILINFHMYLQSKYISHETCSCVSSPTPELLLTEPLPGLFKCFHMYAFM